MSAEQHKPRTREDRKRARSQRGWSTRSNRVAQLPPAPAAPLDLAPAPNAPAAPQAPAEPLDLLPPPEPLPPEDPSWIFGRPRWHWAALAGISVFIGVLVGFATQDGALVLSSTVAAALALLSFMTLWRPPRLPADQAPAAPTPAIAAPAAPAAAPPAPAARPNRAARRRGARVVVQPSGPIDLALPEDQDVVDDALDDPLAAAAPSRPAPTPRGRP